jgi:hypothetical protein
MISLLLLSSALAGDLSRAWRGTPYGLATVLAEPPSEHCTQGPEPTIAWTCAQTVGEAPVTVRYWAEEGYYWGVGVECKGFTACQTLFEALYEAWDVSFSKKLEGDTSALADGFWNVMGSARGETSGVWTYNRYSDQGSVLLVQMGLQRAAIAKRKAAAQKTAEDL